MPPNIVTDGLVAYYHAARAKLGTAPGNNTDPVATWDDLMGAYDGAIQGCAWNVNSGWAGAGTLADPYRLVCDGSGDYVRCGDLSLADDFSFTYECWFNQPSPSASNSVPMGEGNSGNATPYSMIYLASNGNLGCQIRNDDGAFTSRGVSPVVNFADGAWHHLGMACDGTNMQLYADNALRNAAIAIVKGSGLSLDHAALGALWRTTPGSYAPGSIAVARFYNRGLSLAELQQNYAAGYLWPGVVPIQHHYRMRRAA